MSVIHYLKLLTIFNKVFSTPVLFLPIFLNNAFSFTTRVRVSIPSLSLSLSEAAPNVGILRLSSQLYQNQKEGEVVKQKTKAIPIVSCASTIEIERAISFYVQQSDSVLELGSQLNDVSLLLCQKVGIPTMCGQVALVDIKRKDATSGRCQPRDIDTFVNNVKQMKNRQQSGSCNKDETGSETTATTQDGDNVKLPITFRELEQFDQWRDVITNVSETSSFISPYNVIIIDVGTMIGNDLHLTALTIANEIIAKSQQQGSILRLIIIKSKMLSSLARRIVHSQRMFDGSVVLPKPEDIPRSSSPFIVASVGVNEYRRTIPFVVKSGDEIIEVGCHFGQTTVLLHEGATHGCDGDNIHGFCIGVDIGPKIIKHAKSRYPHVSFHVGNAWETLQLLKVRYDQDIQNRYNASIAPTKLGYDVVYADIGGLSGADGLMESLSLLEAIGYGMEPRVIVIKSLCMNRLASQLRAFSNVWPMIETKIEIDD